MRVLHAKYLQLENELMDLGLDIPFSIKLSIELQNIGVAIGNGHLTEEELVKDLCELHSKM